MPNTFNCNICIGYALNIKICTYIIITLIFKHTRIDCLCQLSLIVAFYVDRQLQVLFVKLRNTFSQRLSNVSFVLLFQCKTLNDEVEIIGVSVTS